LGGSGGATEARGVTVDSLGNVFVTGVTSAALDGQTLAGTTDLFLVRFVVNAQGRPTVAPSPPTGAPTAVPSAPTPVPTRFPTAAPTVVAPGRASTGVAHGVRVPQLSVAEFNGLNADITVHWAASSGLDEEATSHSLDWIGLFKAGSCSQNRKMSTTEIDQNSCYLGYQLVQPRQRAGSVSFSYADHRWASGQYEARYFLGDSQEGNGVVCRKLDNTGDSQGSFTTYTVTTDANEKYLVSVNGAPSNPVNTPLSMTAGNAYMFDLSDPSNAQFPLYISLLPRGDSRTVTEYAVTVANNKYWIDGVQSPQLILQKGHTYVFNLIHSSVSMHPLGIVLSPNNGIAYATGVTYEINGISGLSRIQFESGYNGVGVTSRSVTFVPADTTTVYYGRVPISNAMQIGMGNTLAIQINPADETTEYVSSDIVYKLDGVPKTIAQYTAGFAAATSRTVTYSPAATYDNHKTLYFFTKKNGAPLGHWTSPNAGSRMDVFANTNFCALEAAATSSVVTVTSDLDIAESQTFQKGGVPGFEHGF